MAALEGLRRHLGGDRSEAARPGLEGREGRRRSRGGSGVGDAREAGRPGLCPAPGDLNARPAEVRQAALTSLEAVYDAKSPEANLVAAQFQACGCEAASHRSSVPAWDAQGSCGADGALRRRGRTRTRKFGEPPSCSRSRPAKHWSRQLPPPRSGPRAPNCLSWKERPAEEEPVEKEAQVGEGAGQDRKDRREG